MPDEPGITFGKNLKKTEMEKAFAKAEELAGAVKEYINTTVESAKINAAAKTSGVIATIVAAGGVAAISLFFLLMLSTALAFGLGEWWGKTWLGFLAVALLYLCLAAVVWVARRKIIQWPVMNALVKQLFTTEEEEEEDEED